MRIVVLTGAGVSAESGLATFRDADGLWEGHRPEDVATPEAFASDPDMVQRFYDERRRAVGAVQPNAAHRALARLEAALGDDLYLITQNIDDLHERGGSLRVQHMHGELLSAWCTGCDGRYRWTATLADRPACPGCGAARLRPDVVWFGEMPYGMDAAQAALLRCELFVAIGTSGVVYPAAGFGQLAATVGAGTVEMNLEPGANAGAFDDVRTGRATELVPAWVDQVLSG